MFSIVYHSCFYSLFSSRDDSNFIRASVLHPNVRRVAMWPSLVNVPELFDMTRFLQTLGMCPKGLAQRGCWLTHRVSEVQRFRADCLGARLIPQNPQSLVESQL
jgi:hypothetical protein